MTVRLTGNAGTGEKILNNWELFRYNLNKSKSTIDSYYFDIVFGNQKGHMVVFLENGKISESTVIDCDFSRPLGAYNDTRNNDGLYKVARRMLESYSVKI
ncbi:hypothetical protein [Bacillus cereus]|uniref:Uncharacterized protein n=1 Tax=Bacillus cereus TaxID=1396 RepID=A0A0G8EYG0_BACCE|nr:hypothetical protein [Bacillus cereus]KLA29235.1 hypothetical protein B4077_0834 [Bacillus cereus]